MLKLVVQVFGVDVTGDRKESRRLLDERVHRLVSFVFINKPSAVGAAF